MLLTTTCRGNNKFLVREGSDGISMTIRGLIESEG